MSFEEVAGSLFCTRGRGIISGMVVGFKKTHGPQIGCIFFLWTETRRSSFSESGAARFPFCWDACVGKYMR